MCAKILEAASKINMDEYSFFLRGGVVSILFTVFDLWQGNMMRPHKIIVCLLCFWISFIENKKYMFGILGGGIMKYELDIITKWYQNKISCLINLH